MSARNQFIFIGNVGKDPELKTTGNGTAYCNVSVAVNKRYKDDSGETKTLTNWFSVTLWGKKAETLSKYIKKGATIAVNGELVTRKRKVGDEEITVPDFKVDEVEILSGGKVGGGRGQDEDDISSGSDDFDSDDI
jgi:single-strand DNA-binding protein